MKRRLIVSDGQRERELLLVGTIVVGRDPTCEVSEDNDSLLSRRHTEFVASAEGVLVRDLGSRNGTFVNGVKIAEGPIKPGDIVHIGHLRLRYVEGDAPAPTQSAPPPVHTPEDDEVTRIVQSVKPLPPRPAPAPPPAAADDNDRTVVTPRPGASPVRPPALPAPVSAAGPAADSAADSDDERTVFVTSSKSSSPGRAAVPVVPPPAARPAAVRAGAHASDVESLATFVAIQVAVAASIAFLTAAIAAALGGTELLGGASGAGAWFKWLGPAAAIALVAAYGVGRTINRRIVGILTADKEDGRGV